MLIRGLVGTILGVSCAAVVGYFLGVRPSEVVQYLAGVPVWAVCACALSSYVVLAFQSLRWHGVMGPLLGMRYPQAYRAQVVGAMFNALIPARGGDLLRVQYLGRRTGKSRATILGTEIVDRWLDWWGWIPVILLLAVTNDLPRWVFVAVAVFGGALATWAITMVVLTRRGYSPKSGSRIGKTFLKLQGGIQAFRTNRIWIIAFLIAPLPWIWEASVLTTVSPAFGIHINLAQAFCVLIGFNLATVVPSPGAVGTVEAGGTAALVFFGTDQSRALAFMFIYHFAQLLPGIVTGVAILAAEGEYLVGARRLTLKAAEVAPGDATNQSPLASEAISQ